LGNYSNQFQQFKRIKLTAVEQLLDMDRSATSKKRKKKDKSMSKTETKTKSNQKNNGEQNRASLF
jgi:uncharacterized protein YaiL (DUF2058 family)